MKSAVAVSHALFLGGLLAHDWTGYERIENSAPAVAPVNPDFSLGSKGWKVSWEGKVLSGVGTQMSPGLFIERRNPRYYTLTTQNVEGLVPGKRYNLRAMIRCENIAGGKVGATFGIEHYDKDRRFISLTGSYPRGCFGTTDWTEIQIKGHQIPPDAAYSTVIFYIGEKSTGKAWFDDLLITPADSRWTVYFTNTQQDYLSPRTALKMRIDTGDGSSLPDGLKAWVGFDGRETVADIRRGFAVFPATVEWNGSGGLTARIFSQEKKTILADARMPLRIGGGIPKVSFDANQRTLVDGKRFLPIGIFGNISNRKTVDQMVEAGFNVVMPYNSVHMGVDGLRGYAGIKAALDYCQKKQLRVIFCLKGCYPWGDSWAVKGLYGEKTTDGIASAMARRFGSHPALFAWYTADEVSPQYIPDLGLRKRLLHGLDHDHPVWQVHALGYNTESLVSYGPTLDVVGIDHYPFKNPASSRLDGLEAKLAKAAESGMPHWFVPQMFNSRRFSGRKDTAFPTPGEFRSQILVAAGCGIKAFIFYVYQPLCLPDPVLDGDAAKMKATICDGTALLRKLEPFILSDRVPERIPVKIISGKVSAWRFRDGGGDVCFSVVSLTPGRSIAELTIQEDVASFFGKTRKTNGRYVFESENIDCDLLQ